MNVLDQFGGKRRRKDNGDPPPLTLPTVARPMDSLDTLGEDASRYFVRVEQMRAANEQMAGEIDRQAKIIMRLEAELDVANAALAAVTAERNDHMNYSVAVKTRLGTVGTLILEVLDAGNQAKTPAPVVDMDAMQAAVAEGPK